MDKLKFMLVGLGLVFTAILFYFAVTLAMSLFWYLVFVGVIGLGGYGAYKFLSRPKSPQLERGTPERELESAQKLLDDYRRKIESGKQ